MYMKNVIALSGILNDCYCFFSSQYRVPRARSITYSIILFVLLQMTILLLHFHLYFQFMLGILRCNPMVSRGRSVCVYICREGNGTPLQYSCLENPMDGGAW